MEGLLNLSKAAQTIGISRWAVSLAVQEQRLKAERFGPYLLITVAEALRYKENSEHNPNMQRRNPKYRVSLPTRKPPPPPT